MSHSNAANLSMSLSTFGSIRKTEDGRVSVYDLISVVGGKKNPHDAWKRLTDEYSDLLAKCERVKLPNGSGRGSVQTPVTDKEGALYLIGLLPGTVGKTYREEAAKLVLRYLEGDVTLATEIVNRTKNLKELEKHKEAVDQHIQYLDSYHGVHDQLKTHGCKGLHHGSYNAHVNRLSGVVTGQRGEMTREQKMLMMAAQAMSEVALIRDSESLGWTAVKVAKSAANLVKALPSNDDIPVYNF